jgi:hypothetical protein
MNIFSDTGKKKRIMATGKVLRDMIARENKRANGGKGYVRLNNLSHESQFYL